MCVRMHHAAPLAPEEIGWPLKASQAVEFARDTLDAVGQRYHRLGKRKRRAVLTIACAGKSVDMSFSMVG
jgi:hypothetical protein